MYRLKEFFRRNYVSTKYKWIQKSVNFEPSTTITIFSDPRGGSTWLTEAINTIHKSVVLWEPLAINYCSEYRNLNFGWRQYIPKNQKWEAAHDAFNGTLKGKGLNHWTGLFEKPKDFVEAEQLIVKFCRGNALLPWFTSQFQLQHQPVYLVRHPFAVVASQIEQGGWNYEFDGFHIPEGPFNDQYLTHKKFLKSIKTKEEALTATWCLTNQVPLTDKGNNEEWITVTYEELLLKPKETIISIFNKWGKEVPQEIFHQLEKKSSTTKDPIENFDEYGRLKSWMKKLSAEQIENMQKVLDYFKVELYSKNNILPEKAFQVKL